MSLWETLAGWDERGRREQVIVRINPENVYPRLEERAIVPGGSYVRVRLAELMLRRENRVAKRRLPAVFSLVCFESASRLYEVPCIADPMRVGMREDKRGDTLVGDLMLTPTIPYNGGRLALSAGLLAFKEEGVGFVGDAIEALGRETERLKAGQLSALGRDYQKLSRSIQDLYGAGRGRVHIGFHQTYSAGDLRDGYIAVLRGIAPPPSAESLYVRDGELFVNQGGALRPLEETEYMLLRIEISEHAEPEEIDRLESVRRRYSEALTALREGDEGRAAVSARTAAIIARESPELTEAYRGEIVKRLARDFREAADEAQTSNLTRDDSFSLGQVMVTSFNVKRAAARGAPTDADLDALIPVPPGGESVAAAAAREDLPPVSEAPAFYLSLVGKEVEGNAVRCGTDADLIFNYDPPPPEALATLKARDVEEVRRQGGELGVGVIPVGFTLREGPWHQTATFENGRIKEPLSFKLRASEVPHDDALLHIIFDKKGRVIYEFDLSVRCVTDLSSTSPFGERRPLDLDLDELAAEGEGRTARLLLRSDNDNLVAAYVGEEGEDDDIARLPWLTVPKLSNLIEKLPAELLPAANHAIWTQALDPLAAPLKGSRIKAYRECMKYVVSAGSILREGLEKDEKLKAILAKINALPPGSTLQIKTDCAFLPWEIFYPGEYNHAWDDKDIQPQELWGARFSIECLLLGGAGGGYKPPLALHKKTPASVSFNVNKTIDDHQVFKDAEYKPVAAQIAAAERGFAGGAVKASPVDPSGKIVELLNSKDYGSTFIYFFCHGQSEGPLDARTEKLELGSDVYVEPGTLDPRVKFAAAPLVFLNSCSSAAISPLSFGNFLSRFKQKQSLGLVGSSFPVPATLAAGFGLALIEEYLGGAAKGVTIGQAMRTLRLRLLADGNPLGLFYTLQCSLEATALVSPAPAAGPSPQPFASSEKEHPS